MRAPAIVLGALALVCLASLGVWIAHGDATRVVSAPDTVTAPDAVIHLRVLNGTDVSGLAGEVSLRLDRAGCVADQVGNAPHAHYEHTLLINRRLDDDRAAALAERLGGCRRLREVDARAAEDAVLVLGADHDRVLGALRTP